MFVFYHPLKNEKLEFSSPDPRSCLETNVRLILLGKKGSPEAKREIKSVDDVMSLIKQARSVKELRQIEKLMPPLESNSLKVELGRAIGSKEKQLESADKNKIASEQEIAKKEREKALLKALTAIDSAKTKKELSAVKVDIDLTEEQEKQLNDAILEKKKEL